MVNIPRAIDKLTGPLRRHVLMMVRRCVLASIDDAGGRQLLQARVFAGEVIDGVERFQNYGVTSHPFPGAEGIALALGGNRNHSVIIAVDDRRYRLTGLALGEVALHDDQGQVVHIKRDGLHLEGSNIHLKSAGVIRIHGAAVEIHGETYVQTDVAGKGSRETFTGGVNYDTTAYTLGATGSTATVGIDQSDIPSSHPEGP